MEFQTTKLHLSSCPTFIFSYAPDDFKKKRYVCLIQSLINTVYVSPDHKFDNPTNLCIDPLTPQMHKQHFGDSMKTPTEHVKAK